MRWIIVGAHLRREDVEPLATAMVARNLVLSCVEVADDQQLGDRDLLLTIARTRAALLDRATFVAIRYGFTVYGENEALAKCGGHLARWRTLLEAHRLDVEMTLKVAAEEPRARPDRRDFASGAAYLRALQESVTAAAVSEEFRLAAEKTMAGTQRRWTHRDSKSLELAALIARTEVAQVQQGGEQLKHAFPDVPFLISGPWPLEVFALEGNEGEPSS
jgi:Gas vesicle synthesis protein GvpL/GvpF